MALQAQPIPEDLARLLIAAVNEGDRSAIEDLFHPSTKEFYKKNFSKIFDKQIDNLLKKKIPRKYEIRVKRIEEVEQYDLAADTYTYLGIKLKFTQRPDLRIDIDQTEVIKDNEGRAIRVNSEGISEMIIKENGRWYIIRPNVNPDRIKVRRKN